MSSGKYYLMLPNGSIIGPLTWLQAILRRLPGESIVAAEQIEPQAPAAGPPPPRPFEGAEGESD